MNFKSALSLMKQGYKVKLPSWAGYWCYDIERGAIEIHTKDGQVLYDCTERLLYTLENTLSDEWGIAGDANTPILGGCATFNFGEAIKYLKRGLRVCRQGWNGKGQYIEIATNIGYLNANKEIINCKHEAIGNKAIAFVGTSGVQMGWLASQADMLADDWMFYENNAVCVEDSMPCCCDKIPDRILNKDRADADE